MVRLVGGFVCLFVWWVIYFQVASILAAYLRYTGLRDPAHSRLGRTWSKNVVFQAYWNSTDWWRLCSMSRKCTEVFTSPFRPPSTDPLLPHCLLLAKIWRIIWALTLLLWRGRVNRNYQLTKGERNQGVEKLKELTLCMIMASSSRIIVIIISKALTTWTI